MVNPAPPAPVRDGLRERNKRDKLERILGAAREAFGRDGYEKTTLRQVAAAAGVAVGTVFLYTPTKEDLLILVFSRELEPVVEESFRHVPQTDLLHQLLYVYGGIIEHHSVNLRLSRPFLREMNFITGEQRKGVLDFMDRWLVRIVALFEAAKLRGELKADADSSLLAICSRMLFIAGLRSWVSGASTREQLEATLPARIGALLTGFIIPEDERQPVPTEAQAHAHAHAQAQAQAKSQPKPQRRAPKGA